MLAHVAQPYRLIADLIYGSSLRLLEALRLRAKDIDFGYGRIIVRDGKGLKDRVTMLPGRLRRPLREHLVHVKAMHKRDVALGFGEPTGLKFVITEAQSRGRRGDRSPESQARFG